MLQTGSKLTWVWCLAFWQINYIDCWLFFFLIFYFLALWPSLPCWFTFTFSSHHSTGAWPWNKQMAIQHTGHTGAWGLTANLSASERSHWRWACGQGWISKSLSFLMGFRLSLGPGAPVCHWNEQIFQQAGQSTGQNESTPALAEFVWGSWDPRIWVSLWALHAQAMWLCFGGVLASLSVCICKMIITDANTYWILKLH